MNTTKLTVRVPQDLLDDAKDYARTHDTTLTRLISEYLRRLSLDNGPLNEAPIIQRLAGSLPSTVTVDDYHSYLESKHGG